MTTLNQMSLINNVERSHWYGQPGDYFPVEDWQADVANGDTRLGYEDWVIHQMESHEQDPEWLEQLWKDFGNVPIDKNEAIDTRFYTWDNGTDRFRIWHWFDERYPGGVATLQGLINNDQ